MNPRQFKPGESLLLAESALKRVFKGWDVPYVTWHLVTVDSEGEMLRIPQHGANVSISRLEQGEIARLEIVIDNALANPCKDRCGWCFDCRGVPG